MSLIGVRAIQDVNDSETMSINSASFTYYSKSFNIQTGTNFALMYKSDIAQPSVTLVWEQGWKQPDTECAADDWWATPTGYSNIDTNLNESTAKSVSISPIALPYGRIKVTSAAATVSTTLTLYLGIVENL